MLKAIETRYNGYRFRSRLEARHAVFFDVMGVRYEYEKEGFDLGDGVRYLPDFWLPEQKTWVEIKGDEPSDLDIEKVYRLVKQSGKTVCIFTGEIEMPLRGVDVSMLPVGRLDTCSVEWLECPVCGMVSLGIGCDCLFPLIDAFGEIGDHIKAENKGWWINSQQDFLHQTFSKTPRLLRAYTAARSARFEFGEKGGR